MSTIITECLFKQGITTRNVIYMEIPYWIQRIRNRMKEEGVTQDKLAESLNVSQGAINHWLCQRRDMTVLEVESIAKELRWALSDVFTQDYQYVMKEDRSNEGLPIHESKLLEYYRSLTESQKLNELEQIKKRKEENEAILQELKANNSQTH